MHVYARVIYTQNVKMYIFFLIFLQGENLDLAMSKEEVVALIGDGECAVKTLTRNHLYCEPPAQQPPVSTSKKRDANDALPEFTVRQPFI